ncbi:MAG: hypothetical protein PHV23_02170 [Candidatus Gracilibacteria bacterium]|nr:hypothetical protein [Candidatus Gracilibacteria bacterium]
MPLILQSAEKINLFQYFLTKSGKELYKLVEPIFDEELFIMCKD